MTNRHLGMKEVLRRASARAGWICEGGWRPELPPSRRGEHHRTTASKRQRSTSGWPSMLRYFAAALLGILCFGTRAVLAVNCFPHCVRRFLFDQTFCSLVPPGATRRREAIRLQRSNLKRATGWAASQFCPRAACRSRLSRPRDSVDPRCPCARTKRQLPSVGGFEDYWRVLGTFCTSTTVGTRLLGSGCALWLPRLGQYQ